MLCKIHSTENDVIMAMLLVDVGSDDILILAAENFIDKLLPDLVGLYIADLTQIKGLYQMVSEIVARSSAVTGTRFVPQYLFAESIKGVLDMFFV